MLTIPVVQSLALRVAARRDKHRVDAIVRLFEDFTYLVVLSDHYDGADFCNTLVYDAYCGEVNGMLFAHTQTELLQTEDVAISKETVLGDLEAFSRNFCAFLEAGGGAKTPQGSHREKASGASGFGQDILEVGS